MTLPPPLRAPVVASRAPDAPDIGETPMLERISPGKNVQGGDSSSNERRWAQSPSTPQQRLLGPVWRRYWALGTERVCPQRVAEATRRGNAAADSSTPSLASYSAMSFEASSIRRYSSFL